MPQIAWLLLAGFTGLGLGALLCGLWLRARQARALAAAGAQIAALQARLEEQQRAGAEKLVLLEQARGQMTAQFQQLAHQVLEDKARRFTEHNRVQIEQVLGPLRERLGTFEQQVRETYERETRDRVALFQQVQALQVLNRKVSEDTQDLSRALRSDTRSQGVWGEVILERILEASGLQKGREYDLQVAARSEDGRRLRPDAVVHLPGERDIVIDSKVSLSAYLRAADATDAATRATALGEHVQALRVHLAELARRDYTQLEGVRTLDFVLMLVPSEAAYIEALRARPELLEEAIRCRVALLSPSSLLPTLRAIEHLWRIEHQNRHAADIAGRAGRLYDKFAAFAADLLRVGEALDSAQEAYREARSKLTDGSGNVVRQAEMLKALGAKAGKSIPAALLDEAQAGADADETLQPRLLP